MNGPTSVIIIGLIVFNLWSLMPPMIHIIDSVVDDIYAWLRPSIYFRDKVKHKHRYSAYNKVCVHEAGHALCAWACTKVRHIDYIKIHTMGNGSMQAWWPRQNIAGMWSDLVISMGGLAAETAYYGRAYTGNGKTDLKMCLDAAIQLEKWNADIPPWSTMTWRQYPAFSKLFSQLSDRQHSILQHAYAMSRHILETHQQRFRQLTDELVKQRRADSTFQMEGKEIEALLGDRCFIKTLSTLAPNTLFVLPQQQQQL